MFVDFQKRGIDQCHGIGFEFGEICIENVECGGVKGGGFCIRGDEVDLYINIFHESLNRARVQFVGNEAVLALADVSDAV